ncbi:MAG: hypothetical protein FWC00_03620 [Firmicutes bacterium]|nr:hypothetical protein [Bacillota bacterium]
MEVQKNVTTEKQLVQCGVTAMRTPDKKFLPSSPMFMFAEHLEQNGLTQFENQACANVSGFFADKRKEQNHKKGVIENGN